jgi:N-acetylmuramoyl-L-alanine amidase
VKAGNVVKGLVLLAVACAAPHGQAAELLLDPGHSVRSSGALSCTGKSEYRYNLALSAVVERYLAGRGVSVELSHAPGAAISLIDRTRHSGSSRLFLSLHHDSVQPQFISWRSGRPCSEKGAGFSIFVSRKNAQFARSRDYARFLGEALVQRGLRPSTHHQELIPGEGRTPLYPEIGVYLFDDLIVLKSSAAPAVLLEAGVIVNPADERSVASEARQTAIAESIYQAYSRFSKQ